MQTRTNWAIRVIVALAALAVVAVVLVGNWRLPVPAPAAAPRPYSDAVRAPAEATVFPQVLSVYDAAAHDGMWYVLDVQGTQVHRVDPVTGSVRTFGRKGEGPGELDIPNGIVVHGDSVLVLDFRTLRVFGLEGQHYDDRRLGIRGTCKLEDGLSVSGALLLLLGCSELGEVTYHVVVEADDESLTELAAVSRVLGDIGGVVVLGPHPNGFIFGRPYDDCMKLFGIDGTTLGEECHGWIERIPVPEMPDEIKEQMEEVERRYRRIGTSMQLPEHMTPFQRVSVTSAGRLVYQAPAPDDGSIDRLLARSATGEQAVHPVFAPILFADGDHVLAAWEDFEGMSLLFAEVDKDKVVWWAPETPN